jgi:hypothetical protein
MLTLNLPAELYERLRLEAERLGETVPTFVQKLLAELGPEMKIRAERSTMTLEEGRAALDKAGGKPLSELILEMRGPKE